LGKFTTSCTAHELWILAGLGGLVVTGGMAGSEFPAQSSQGGFPWLFAFSVLCFLINVAIIVAHRAG
jgi:hypothetical protein